MKVAIIPARGGSKRIPGKNFKSFCGKPMIAWSIETARLSGCFDRIIVSTDDAEIADIVDYMAKTYGNEREGFVAAPKDIAKDPAQPVAASTAVTAQPIAAQPLSAPLAAPSAAPCANAWA